MAYAKHNHARRAKVVGVVIGVYSCWALFTSVSTIPDIRANTDTNTDFVLSNRYRWFR